MTSPSSPAAPSARRFWLGEPPRQVERSAAEILAALEAGTLDLSTPLRSAPTADPTTVARSLRELVWMERRENESLEGMAELVQGAFESASIGIVIADLAGRIVRTNAAFARFLEYSPEELVGVPIGQISYPGSRAEELALGNEMLAGRRPSFQVERAFRARSGGRVDTLTEIAAVRDAQGALSGVVAHVFDLQTQRRLEGMVEEQTRARIESEERFERLFRNAPQAMIMVDPAGRIVNANLAADALFGYGPAELDGLPLAALLPEEHRRSHERRVETYSRDAPSVRMAPGRDVAALRKDGRHVLVEVGLVPVTVAGVRLTLAGVTDVTEARRARDALSRSLHEKETLLREIHHRVKNNLQIVSSLLSMQSDGLPDGPATAALADSVARVRSMALVHQLLYTQDSLARVDLQQYVVQLAPALSRTFRPEARLRVEAESIAVSVESAIPLGLILNELISNALKYAFPVHPGPVGAGEEGWDLRVRVHRGELGLVIGVDDHGPGFAVEDGRRPGSLGMSLVQSLVRQVRGRLVVRSERGARVELHCPID